MGRKRAVKALRGVFVIFDERGRVVEIHSGAGGPGVTGSTSWAKRKDVEGWAKRKDVEGWAKGRWRARVGRVFVEVTP